MTSQPKTSRIPAPIYAAAGAGELAYQQLRKLPAVVSDLRNRVAADLGAVNGAELRQKANETLQTATVAAENLRRAASDLDLNRLREAATRNAAVVAASAQAAQERAVATYGALVGRGERVVGAGVLEAADTVNTDIETTEKVPAPVEAPTPADVAEAAEVKPAAVTKRTTKSAGKPASPSAKSPRATKRTRPAGD
ncbi:hypothetical protein [Salinispora arenicola]|uniref:Heparin binding hemagglutinin HbhA n=1 Tax=Salinispora arenicola TaxID=168697 RepID=A0A542XJ10_SALAC|nr:hypothetical protein [Salinispora arenicola]MCN0150746.1 hypothetical protein [Salinispora arenicola]TQL35806.1 hypothetical protein FB564_0874 [Salinispora arenicola]GIM82583.1 hypothetical protein Sar04_07960 [Salinispora arenicola]